MKTSIITLCYNQLENATKPFIDSIYKYTQTDFFELIIVNNGSDDGTYEYLEKIKKEKNNITIIHNKINLGYAKGNNQALAIAKGDFLIMANNDVLFTPNWMEKFIYILSSHQDIGILSTMTNYASQKEQLVINADELTTSNYIEKVNFNYEKKELIYLDRIVFFIWGMRRDVFKKIGYLDENFGLAWYEDDDYTLRVLYNGYKPAIATNIFIFHNHSQTSHSLEESESGKILMEKNRQYFLQKHKPKYNHFLERIFSVKNFKGKKIITLFFIRIKIKRNKKYNID